MGARRAARRGLRCAGGVALHELQSHLLKGADMDTDCNQWLARRLAWTVYRGRGRGPWEQQLRLGMCACVCRGAGCPGRAR